MVALSSSSSQGSCVRGIRLTAQFGRLVQLLIQLAPLDQSRPAPGLTGPPIKLSTSLM